MDDLRSWIIAARGFPPHKRYAFHRLICEPRRAPSRPHFLQVGEFWAFTSPHYGQAWIDCERARKSGNRSTPTPIVCQRSQDAYLHATVAGTGEKIKTVYEPASFKSANVCRMGVVPGVRSTPWCRLVTPS